MVIDYKDVAFSFEKKKRRRFIRRTCLSLAAAVVIGLIFFIKSALVRSALDDVARLLLDNQPGPAGAAVAKIEGSMFYGDTQQELKALVCLFNREYPRAEAILARLVKETTALSWEQFLVYFANNARGRELEIYTDYLLKKGKNVSFYKILARTAFFDGATSTALIGQLPRAEKEKWAMALDKIKAINSQLQSGKLNYIFDMNGKPLAYFDLVGKKTIALVPGFDFSSFDAQADGSIKFYSLTINSEIQSVLHDLFHFYHGFFMLLDLEDGSIAAAYSKPFPLPGSGYARTGGRGSSANGVFHEEYIPASIIKVLTLFAYLKEDGADLFPFRCAGNMVVDNKLYYDWLKHDRVSSFNEALAISCNIVFARMGLRLGFDKLAAVLETFFFNSPPFSDLFWEFRTGRFKKNETGNYSLARLSVGLSDDDTNMNTNTNTNTNTRTSMSKSKNRGTGTIALTGRSTSTGRDGDRNGPGDGEGDGEAFIRTTTFHNALLAAVIAHDGTISSPYLIKNIKNVLDLGFYNHQEQIITTFTANRIFFKIKEAMKAVVNSPRGVGRRARVDFMEIAIKTGTCGSSRRGFDAILVGFFPVEKAKYAFAFILQRAGKAEIEGTRFLKDFLEAFQRLEKR